MFEALDAVFSMMVLLLVTCNVQKEMGTQYSTYSVRLYILAVAFIIMKTLDYDLLAFWILDEISLLIASSAIIDLFYGGSVHDRT